MILSAQWGGVGEKDRAKGEGDWGLNKASDRRCLHDVLVLVVLLNDSRTHFPRREYSRYELVELIAAANDTDSIKSKNTASLCSFSILIQSDAILVARKVVLKASSMQRQNDFGAR